MKRRPGPPTGENNRRSPRGAEPSWQARLHTAREQAQFLEEAERIDQTQQELLLSFLEGEIGLEEVSQRVDELSREITGLLPIEDAASLRHILMEVLDDADLVEELTRHEIEHFERAQEFEFPDTIFVVRFFKDQAGITLRAGVEFDFPLDRDEELVRTQLREIIEAPDDPSDLDLCLME